MKPVLVLLFVSVSLIGCDWLEGGGGKLKIISQEQAGSCENLGKVSGFSAWGGQTEALDILKKEASKLGGNAIVLESGNSTISSSGQIHGNALDCPEQTLK